MFDKHHLVPYGTSFYRGIISLDLSAIRRINRQDCGNSAVFFLMRFYQLGGKGSEQQDAAPDSRAKVHRRELSIVLRTADPKNEEAILPRKGGNYAVLFPGTTGADELSRCSCRNFENHLEALNTSRRRSKTQILDGSSFERILSSLSFI